MITHRGLPIKSFLKTKPEIHWLQNILAIQEAIARQEIDIIQKTLALVQKPNISEIHKYIEENVERSIQWCKDHNETINQNWYDKEWRQRTVHDETKELSEAGTLKVNGWRGLSEVSQTYSPEQNQQRQRHHAGTFARTRPARAFQSSSREPHGGNPDEEGWQKV